MKLPQRTPPIQLSDDNEIVRHVSSSNASTGVAPSGLCDHPGKVCQCINGTLVCSIPNTRYSGFSCGTC